MVTADRLTRLIAEMETAGLGGGGDVPAPR